MGAGMQGRSPFCYCAPHTGNINTFLIFVALVTLIITVTLILLH